MALNEATFIKHVKDWMNTAGDTTGFYNEKQLARYKSYNASEREELELGKKNGDPLEIVDGLCDCLWTHIGVLLSTEDDKFAPETLRRSRFLLPTTLQMHLTRLSRDCFDECWLEVRRSNYSKFFEQDGKLVCLRDSNGKVAKPPTYSQPNLSPILLKHKVIK